MGVWSKGKTNKGVGVVGVKGIGRLVVGV